MGKNRSIIWQVLIPLFIWCVIAIAAFSMPIPQEPDTLPLETWSYYNARPDHVTFLIKNRNEILIALFILALAPDILYSFMKRMKPS
jgi:hypothetical protein